MNRSELTVKYLENEAWYPTDRNELRLKDIVYNIQAGTWKHLRTRLDESEVYESDEFTICAHYAVYSHKEYLETSEDGKTWYKVAYRYVPFNKHCIYAD